MYPNDYTENDRKISEMLHAAVGDDLVEINLPEFDEIEKLAKERTASRRRKIRKTLLGAACFCLAVIFVSFGFAIWLDSNSARAAKFGFEKFLTTFKLGGMTSADQYDVGDKYISATFDNEEDIKECKKILPALCLPGYIPEGYQFTSLSIVKRENASFEAYFTYIENENELYIDVIGGINSDVDLYIEGEVTANEIEEGKPFVTEQEEYGIYSVRVVQNEQLISISDPSLKEEILMKIAEEMK